MPKQLKAATPVADDTNPGAEIDAALEVVTEKMVDSEKELGAKLKKTNAPAVATTSVEGKDGITDVAITLLDGPIIPSDYTGPHARVTVALTTSVELAKFQYAKPMVSLEVPAHPSRIEAAYAFAQAWVDEKLAQMVHEIEEARDNAQS